MTVIQNIEENDCGCDRLAAEKALISVDDAKACISRRTRTITETETVPLAQATGRVLARSVRALGMVPPFDNAAMDGYAINTGHLTGQGPWDIEVVGRVAAGQAAVTTLLSNAAIQIFTGAPVPAGANAVIMQEDVERRGNSIRLKRAINPGSHIRRAGEDIVAGKTLVPAGRLLAAKDIAVCAAAGHASVQVVRRVRVAILVTGDEVCQPGQAKGAAGIWDVNTPMLSAAMASPDIELCGAYVAADTPVALRAQLDKLVDGVDLIVTTGGISVGQEDHVKPCLADLDAVTVFSGVALKPGKPVSFGHVRGTYWLGLPGNPLSSLVTWHLFGTALIAVLAGRTENRVRRRQVLLSRGLHHRPGRCEYRLARLTGCDGSGHEVVDFPDTTHSGRVAQLTDMDGLLLIPADAATLPRGALVEFQPF